MRKHTARIVMIVLAILALLLFAFYYRFLRRTPEGYPVLKFMEQDISPNGEKILRKYGTLGNATVMWVTRIEVEEKGEKHTIYYQEKNPLEVEIGWDAESQHILIDEHPFDLPETK